MKFIETPLNDCFVIEPRIFKDDRGYFYESFQKTMFEQETGLAANFVQDNCSYSKYGVIRGLHFQKSSYAQAKLVSVMEGEVLDVVVDLRDSSSTYGKTFSVRLSDENKKQLFVPRGFAHGFGVLSKHAKFVYKCDNAYMPDFESGIRYDDPSLQIDWHIPPNHRVISEKDLLLNYWQELQPNQ